jgi:hypothetical protein
MVVEIDQPGVISTAVGGRKGKPILHMVNTTLSAHRQNVRCINQTQLNTRDSAPVSVRE